MQHLLSAIICVMIFGYSPVTYSLIYAKLDTLFEADQTAYKSIYRIEERAEINWHNNNNSMLAGLKFDIKYKENDQPTNNQDKKQIRQQIKQLFFTHKISAINYTLGRLNRADNLGYYTLDGIIMQYRKKNWSADLHSGKPLLIEDYRTIDAKKIYGINIYHHTNYKTNSIINKFSSRLGWQQIYNDKKQTYIHWGLTSKGKLKNSQFNNLDMFFNGTYLRENKSPESINIGAQTHSKNAGLARLSFTSWQPEQANLSFKERFYSVYTRGKQSSLQMEIFHNHTRSQQYYIRSRKVWREYGNNGYGVSAGFKQRTSSKQNFDWQTQWDSLALKNDTTHSLYMGINKNISATLRAHFNTAIQYLYKKLTPNNRILALETGANKMLNSTLFIDFNLRYIINDEMKNEYRIGFRLSYRFDDHSWRRK